MYQLPGHMYVTSEINEQNPLLNVVEQMPISFEQSNVSHTYNKKGGK